MVTDYDVGYAIGLTWGRSGTPGGPHVYTARYTNDPIKTLHRAKLEEDSKAASAEWFRGFNEGITTQNKGNEP